MTEEIKIEVTPNLKKCLEILKEATAQLPPGDLEKKAAGAIKYMTLTFDGQPQPMDGEGCPPGIVVIPI